MSERNKLPQQDYSKFDTMSTDTLEEILRLDAQLPEGETPDPDAILYIMEVLAQRERENESEHTPDVEAAWRSFNQNYRPYTEDTTSLYEDLDLNSEIDTCETVKNIQDAPLTSVVRPRRKWRGTGFRMGFAAMIAVAVLFASTATASALGFNIWDALAKWTGEVFGFSAEQEESSAAKQLKVLQRDMAGHGITENVLPTYLPKGYEVVSTKSQVKSDYIRFDCLLSDGNGNIMLNYLAHSSTDFGRGFEKDITNPELYEVDGIMHYIMTNMDTYFVVWANENVECNIYGIKTVEEAKKIIDSIYKE